VIELEPKATHARETLVDVLRRRAADNSADRHLVLLEDDREIATLTFGDLLERSQSVARGLRARGIEGRQTVALMLPTGLDFFTSFAGILLAGAVPVPIYPPVKIDQIEEYAERQVRILANAGVRALLTPRQATKLARLLQPRVESLEHILRPEELVEMPAGAARDAVAPRPSPSDLGLIQYTSGSTGDPKGVALTHANLVANIESIGEAVDLQPDEVVVSWLPLYHDMGLIGCWLFALYHGLPIVCFSPLDFLRRPKRWLRVMSDYGGTLSPAPNFAYELCVRRVRERDLEGLDLSSWRVALNGAEPVNPDTLERFAEKFGPYGFKRGSMLPVYGLAENAVALTFPPVGRPPRVEVICRETLRSDGVAALVSESECDDSQPLRSVSVGSPIPANEIRLVDDDGHEVSERIEANIQFRGPSATEGYYRNPEATDTIRTADGWTRTGDRGYLADGELFITGRRKDLIIKAGRNLDPAEVEVLAAEVDGIRRGCVAAIGVPNPSTGSEDLVVVAETRVKGADARKRLAAEARKRISSVTKVSPDEIVLVPPRTVPKTPSGKLRRAETRGRYLSKTLTQRRPPAWVQVSRLAVGAGVSALVAVLWRRRSRRKRDETDPPHPSG
jgi:acyl-CoA synthetase (AMP-forming)/AMP-acid ligase II